MSPNTKFSFLLTLLLLSHTVTSLNWQGAGTVNNTVISRIWDHINANLTTALTGTQSDAQTDAFVKALSDEMNLLWSPAWNVVLVKGNKGYDTILYGYAYKDQWMWFNGIPHPTTSTLDLCIIVWKDYNC